MWDSHNVKFFSHAEATALVGQKVKLNSGITVEVGGTVCEGPGQYSLFVIHNGYFPVIHKTCNNGLYVVA